MSFRPEEIRKDFPILSSEVNKKPLVYMDNGATTQKPLAVINKVSEVYRSLNSNIHRGVHSLSERMTLLYEESRLKISEFINARHNYEVIFTSGATESINVVAFSFGEKYINEGDEIIISAMEHHSNIVPWQLLAERKKAKLKYIPVTLKGELDLDKIPELISDKTKIVAVMHVSNALGTVNDIESIIEVCHRNEIPVLVDAAQSIQHKNIDVQKLDCDFLVFSGHKIYGPTGIGVLYGKNEYLEKMPPFKSGGDMVDVVTLEKTTFNELPFKFEAGTTNYIGAIGLAEAVEYLNKKGVGKIEAYELELAEYANKKLLDIEDLRIYGESENKIATFSFLIDKIHPLDAGMVFGKLGIAIRTGTHCAQPLMRELGVDGTIRASLCFYNTKEEVDLLVEAINRVKTMFG